MSTVSETRFRARDVARNAVEIALMWQCVVLRLRPHTASRNRDVGPGNPTSEGAHANVGRTATFPVGCRHARGIVKSRALVLATNAYIGEFSSKLVPEIAHQVCRSADLLMATRHEADFG